MKKALIIVDVQNDFCEGGALAVPGANEIISYINLLMEENEYDKIVLTQAQILPRFLRNAAEQIMREYEMA